jgi:hypothetical protein
VKKNIFSEKYDEIRRLDGINTVADFSSISQAIPNSINLCLPLTF